MSLEACRWSVKRVRQWPTSKLSTPWSIVHWYARFFRVGNKYTLRPYNACDVTMRRGSLLTTVRYRWPPLLVSDLTKLGKTTTKARDTVLVPLRIAPGATIYPTNPLHGTRGCFIERLTEASQRSMVVCGSVKMYMYGNCGRTETGQAGESWVLDSLVDKNLACMIFQLIPLCNVAFIIPFHVFNPAFRLNMYPDMLDVHPDIFTIALQCQKNLCI